MIETLNTLALAAGHDLNAVVRSESSGISKPESWLVQMMGGGPTNSGVRINANNAMTVNAVYCCVTLISRTIASLPLFLYRRDRRDGRSVADRHPLYTVLHDEPNPWMNSFEFREMMQAHLLLRGNAYAFIMRDEMARVIGLIPVHPDKVTVLKAADGEAYYRLATDTIQGTFSRRDVFHLRGLACDGYVGLSPIAAQRESLGIALATQEHGARLFSNGTVPSGVLQAPVGVRVEKEKMDALRMQFEERYSGLRNAHRPLILDGGMTWTALGMTSEDSQFLETRSFQNHEIYRIFGVPPHMVGDNDKTTSWGTGIEQLSIGFVTWTLRPWLNQWESAIKQLLLLPEERDTFYAEFEVDGLLRGDQKARSEALAIKRQNGIINANEWRRLENMDPIPGPAGDAYLVNGAMISTDAAVAAQNARANAAEGQRNDQNVLD